MASFTDGDNPQDKGHSAVQKVLEGVNPDAPITVGQMVALLVAQSSDLNLQFAKQLKVRDDKIESLERKIDNLEQYSRRNLIRINGLKESDDGDDTTAVKTLIKDQLKVHLEPWEMQACHRIGRVKPKADEKPRQLIVRFSSYHTKPQVIRARRALKGQRIFINEDLTKARAEVAKSARVLKEKKQIKETWTFNGKIFLQDHSDHVISVETLNELYIQYPCLLDYDVFEASVSL